MRYPLAPWISTPSNPAALALAAAAAYCAQPQAYVLHNNISCSRSHSETTTDTGRRWQAQADTGRHRQTQADTCRHRQTQADTGRHGGRDCADINIHRHSAHQQIHNTQDSYSTQHTAHSTQHTGHTQHTTHSTQQHTAHSTQQHTAHSTQHTQDIAHTAHNNTATMLHPPTPPRPGSPPSPGGGAPRRPPWTRPDHGSRPAPRWQRRTQAGRRPPGSCTQRRQAMEERNEKAWGHERSRTLSRRGFTDRSAVIGGDSAHSAARSGPAPRSR